MFKKQFQKLKKDQKGLTLVELLAVVVILAIVAAIAFVVIGNVIENSKKDAQISNAQQVLNAAKLADTTGDNKIDAATGVDAYTLKTLDSLINPWTKTKYTTATAFKDKNGKFTVTLSDEGGKCPITTKDGEALAKDRDTVCGKAE